MATAGRDPRTAPADELATALRGADLVRLASAPSGDAIAATGTLARALVATGSGFQASVIGPAGEATRATDADLTLAIGREEASADLTIAGPEAASATAHAVATTLETTPDPALALAGCVAARELDERIVEAVDAGGLTRRPGLAIPTAALAGGLAHSTLVHAPFSGDVESARDALAELSIPVDAVVTDVDDEDSRRLASFVALAAGENAASDRAAMAVERVLRPYEGGPFATVGGYADVLEAIARERPDVAVSLVLGDDSVVAEALDAWRDHAGRAHAAVRACDIARYDGLVVARGEAMPVVTVARLLADFCVPEPVVLAVADGEAAVARVSASVTGEPDGTDLGRVLATAAAAADGDAIGTPSRAQARFDGDPDALVTAFREAG
jgi:hypothetical protein